MSIAASLRKPPMETPTAFIGATKIGIRYDDRVLCLPCSVTLDPRELDMELERDEDHSQSCASCSSPI